MIKLLAAALALAAVLSAPASAARRESKRASAMANLPSLFSDEDYPAAALRNEEQGTVMFRLDVGADGQVTNCTIAESSGSALLDSTTCRLLRERAHFTPARNASGKAVPDSVTSRVTWRIPEDDPASALAPAAQAAVQLWFACAAGETAKLVPSTLAADQIAERALAACTSLEALAARELGKAPEGSDTLTTLPALKQQFSASAADMVEKMRTMLKGSEAK